MHIAIFGKHGALLYDGPVRYIRLNHRSMSKIVKVAVFGILFAPFVTFATFIPGAVASASVSATVSTTSPNYLGYVSYYWGDATLWAINCDAPFYFPPNTCLPVHVPAGLKQLDGPVLTTKNGSSDGRPYQFVAIYADPKTANGTTGLTVQWYRTSATPFPGSPLPNGYATPPTCTITASPTSVTAGQPVTLTWSSQNATSGNIPNVGTGTSGSKSVNPTQTTTYTDTVTGAGGTAVCSATVTVIAKIPAPTCALSASPTTITLGQPATLTWTSTNATSTSIDNGIGAVAPSGSKTVSPVQTTTYIGTFAGAGGTTKCSATITATSSPILQDIAISNSGFETISSGSPSNWSVQQWGVDGKSTFQSATSQHHSGTVSAQITSAAPADNDARLVQAVTVDPNSWYYLEGWVKTVNVSGGSVGANIAVSVGADPNSGISSNSGGVTGTADWTRQRLVFKSDSTGQVTIQARLGYFGSTVTGTAYFDDMKLQKIVPPTSRHISLVFFPEDYPYLTNTGAWLAQLDDAYDAYKDLVGQTAYGGNTIGYASVAGYPGGEMVSGNPILWWDTYISSRLQTISSNNDLSFGPVHELGHVFDFGTPINTYKYYMGSESQFGAEQWANFKLLYVADTLATKYPNATFYQGSVGYVPIGQFGQKYFVAQNAQSWLNAGRTDWQNMTGDTYTGLLYTLVKQIGWGPFKQTFRDYQTMTTAVPSTDLGQIQLFASELTKNSGVDVAPQFRKWGFPI